MKKSLKNIVALSLIFSSFNVSAQFWDETFQEIFWHLNFGAESLSGDTYFLGYELAFPESIPRLLKVDRFGKEVWLKDYPDYMVDEFENYYYQRITSTSDGNIVFNSSETAGSHVIKIDGDGDIIWSTFVEDVQGLSLIENINSEIIFLGTQNNQITISWLDQNGQLLNQKNYLDNVAPYISTDLNPIGRVKAMPDGTLILYVRYDTEPAPSTNYRPFIIKLDSDDEIDWSVELSTSERHWLEITSDGFVLAFFVESNSIHAAKYDASGTLLWSKLVLDNFRGAFANTNDEGFVIAGVEDGIVPSERVRFLTKFDTDGNEVWKRNYGEYDSSSSSNGSYVSSLILNNDGGYSLFGGQEIAGYFDGFIIRTDAFGYSTTNFMDGIIVRDNDFDCIISPADFPLTNWYVENEKNGEIEITNSDSEGYFSFHIDTGIYTLNVLPPNPYWEPCFSDEEVNSLNPFDSTYIEFPIQASVDCPYMEVDLTTPFLRRCFESTYYVSYCNTGTAEANPAHVEITLDPFLTYAESSIPLTGQSGDTLSFELGNVAIGECGEFTFKVEVSCDAELGQTHCTEAHIYPDSLCIPIPSWSGAQIEVEGVCVNDTIFFNVQNIGTSPTSQPLPFLVIEDDVILFQGDIPILAPQQVEEYHYAGTGMTYRFEANQEPNYPGGNSNPSSTVEACGSGGFSFGFVNQFPQDDEAPIIDIDCRENIGSYDPNDKQGFPTGWGEEHFIHQNTDLEYLIRFQNTGTDTAFTVVIKDTLSNFFNPSTLRLGASSHPYAFRLSGTGILEFTFEDILLPDSATNLEASQGFVKFKVSQDSFVPLGTVIENSAAIYFDFNAPVITNTIWHTVGQDLLSAVFEVLPKNQTEEIKVNVVPNPFSEKAFLEIMDSEMPGENTLSIFDITGRLFLSKKFTGAKTEIDGTNLKTGIYLFHIKNENGVELNGKVVVF